MPRTKPLPKARTCQEFLDEWQPKVRDGEQPIEIDYSWEHDAVTITDMRIPSALRTGVLYKRQEVEDHLDMQTGDFGKRVVAFMSRGLKG